MPFRRLFVRFRYGPPGCSPPVLTRPEELNGSPAIRGFYVRASSHQVASMTAGYDYGAILGTAPAGLSPASTAASLAALPPRALPRFIAHTDLAATVSSSLHFPVPPVIGGTSLPPISRSGRGRLPQLLEHALVTVLSLPPRRRSAPHQSVCDAPCCLRPEREGSASEVKCVGATYGFTHVTAR